MFRLLFSIYVVEETWQDEDLRRHRDREGVWFVEWRWDELLTCTHPAHLCTYLSSWQLHPWHSTEGCLVLHSDVKGCPVFYASESLSVAEPRKVLMAITIYQNVEILNYHYMWFLHSGVIWRCNWSVKRENIAVNNHNSHFWPLLVYKVQLGFEYFFTNTRIAVLCAGK